VGDLYLNGKRTAERSDRHHAGILQFLNDIEFIVFGIIEIL
jgi:hypothetical protein